MEISPFSGTRNPSFLFTIQAARPFAASPRLTLVELICGIGIGAFEGCRSLFQQVLDPCSGTRCCQLDILHPSTVVGVGGRHLVIPNVHLGSVFHPRRSVSSIDGLTLSLPPRQTPNQLENSFLNLIGVVPLGESGLG